MKVAIFLLCALFATGYSANVPLDLSGLTDLLKPPGLVFKKFQQKFKKFGGVFREEVPSIAQAAKDSGLTDLVKLAGIANLTDVLMSLGDNPGKVTVFGPTNEAFSNLPQAAVNAPGNLAKVLAYHILPEIFPLAALQDEALVPSLNGKKIRINLYPKGSKDVKVATAQCSKIDLEKADVKSSNGLLNVVSRVLTPFSGNILQFLNPGFATLNFLLKQTGLDKVLGGDEPFTLIAPTDDAFSNISDQIVRDLAASTDLLKAVLGYHIIPGTFCTAGLTDGPLKTLQGQDVQIKVSKDGGVTLNGAKIVNPDGSVSNGVVQAINKVLIPDGLLD